MLLVRLSACLAFRGFADPVASWSRATPRSGLSACFPHGLCGSAYGCCRLIEEVPQSPAGSTFPCVSASKEQRDGLLQTGFA
jgi:hypothetical protein